MWNMNCHFQTTACRIVLLYLFMTVCLVGVIRGYVNQEYSNCLYTKFWSSSHHLELVFAPTGDVCLESSRSVLVNVVLCFGDSVWLCSLLALLRFSDDICFGSMSCIINRVKGSDRSAKMTLLDMYDYIFCKVIPLKKVHLLLRECMAATNQIFNFMFWFENIYYWIF